VAWAASRPLQACTAEATACAYSVRLPVSKGASAGPTTGDSALPCTWPCGEARQNLRAMASDLRAEAAPQLRTETGTSIGLGGNGFLALERLHPDIVPALKCAVTQRAGCTLGTSSAAASP
jgi:hypothetical protein